MKKKVKVYYVTRQAFAEALREVVFSENPKARDITRKTKATYGE